MRVGSYKMCVSCERFFLVKVSVLSVGMSKRFSHTHLSFVGHKIYLRSPGAATFSLT